MVEGYLFPRCFEGRRVRPAPGTGAGYAGWDDVGKVLYMADYLEPGRNFDSNGRESLIRLVAEDFERALFEVARGRVSWVRSRNWPLLPETSEFWNALLESR